MEFQLRALIMKGQRQFKQQRPLQIYRLHEIGKCNVVTGTKQEIQLLLLTVYCTYSCSREN